MGNRFATATVIGRWARSNCGHMNKKAESGQNWSKSCWYEGPLLYSYRTPIACFYHDHILISSQKFSVTTAKHQRYVMNQCAGRDSYDIFSVPNVTPTTSGGLKEMHERNLQWMVNEFHELERRIIKDFRNTEHRYVHWVTRLRGYEDQIQGYVNMAEMKNPIHIDERIADVQQQRAEKMRKFCEPKAVMKRERAKARKEAKLALGLSA